MGEASMRRTVERIASGQPVAGPIGVVAQSKSAQRVNISPEFRDARWRTFSSTESGLRLLTVIRWPLAFQISVGQKLGEIATAGGLQIVPMSVCRNN